ncbi:CLUMA_CG017087, isoform A [Clunio marinus]|uniref:CLUMA_CG017087, isoform A n=1 Tax=Clunio marinus TaxID=568069 RepID=A0A1J1IXT3_9DIPT|nr:CLUMA_CG017087, isoform A [Clunio marinus]
MPLRVELGNCGCSENKNHLNDDENLYFGHQYNAFRFLDFPAMVVKHHKKISSQSTGNESNFLLLLSTQSTYTYTIVSSEASREFSAP